MEGHQDGQGTAGHDVQEEAEGSEFVQFGEEKVWGVS